MRLIPYTKLAADNLLDSKDSRHKHPPLKVFVNGQDVTAGCFAHNVDRGYAIVYTKDDSGKLSIHPHANGMAVQASVIHGKVELFTESED